jgi:hypothetical protein
MITRSINWHKTHKFITKVISSDTISSCFHSSSTEEGVMKFSKEVVLLVVIAKSFPQSRYYSEDHPHYSLTVVTKSKQNTLLDSQDTILNLTFIIQ